MRQHDTTWRPRLVSLLQAAECSLAPALLLGHLLAYNCTPKRDLSTIHAEIYQARMIMRNCRAKLEGMLC